MNLQEEVAKLMTDPVERSVPMLEATLGEASTPIGEMDHRRLAQAQLLGIREAVLRLAREIEQLRDS